MTDIKIRKLRYNAEVKPGSVTGDDWLKENISEFHYVHTIPLDLVDEFVIELEKHKLKVDVE